MVANLLKVKEMGGRVTSIKHKGIPYIVAIVPAEGFERLVGIANDKGQYFWVHRNFQK